MTFAVEAAQLDATAASLRRLADQLGDTSPLDQEAATLVQRAGAPLVPRRSGALAASLTVRAGSIVSALPYAAPVHWGWRRGGAVVPARPWLLRARDAATDDVTTAAAGYVTQLLQRVEP